MNDVTRFFLEACLRERVGGGAEISSRNTDTEMSIKIKGVKIERDQLEGWLRNDFQYYQIKNLPFGFLAYAPDLSELLVITISANQEFISKVPLPSFVTIQEMGSLLELQEGRHTAPSFSSPKGR